MAHAVLSRVRALLHTPEPPGLGPEVRSHVQSAEFLSLALADLACEGQWSEPQASLLRAALLLWHDHLEAAHRLVQDLEDQDAYWIHGVIHRREPDYANARYWFRRLGVHGAYRVLAAEVGPYLQAAGEVDLMGRLLPGGRWDALAFVDECRCCAGLPAEDPRRAVAVEVQRHEFEVLLRHLASGC